MRSRAKQVLGWAGDRAIRRIVRSSFHSVYWADRPNSVPLPAIFVVNHHGWHDAHLMHLVTSELGLTAIGWFSNPGELGMFEYVGGLPFPANDTLKRTQTIRKTLRFLRQGQTNLVLFPEAELHRPGSLLSFAKSLEFLVANTPGITVIPVAILYEQSMHERPEAYILVGQPLPPEGNLCLRARLEVASLLDRLRATVLLDRDKLSVLISGKDVPKVPRKLRREQASPESC